MTACHVVLAVLSDLQDGDFADATPLDLDSLGRVLLVMGIEEQLDVTFPMDAEFGWQTVGEVVTACEGLVR